MLEVLTLILVLLLGVSLCFFHKHTVVSHQTGSLDFIYTPEGDKYKVARKWGHIHIVTRKWFDQSIARRGNIFISFLPFLVLIEINLNIVSDINFICLLNSLS